MADPADVPDTSRTTRQHAGESIVDSRNWPGLTLILLGLVAVGATLTAAGYGFAGWTAIGAGVAVLCLAAGIGMVMLEHRRVRSRETDSLRESQGR